MPSPVRLLHLEDSARDAEAVRHELDAGGLSCNILLVNNKESFEAALDHESFDLILSDYSLPSYDGVTALKHAQLVQPGVPLIIISGTVGEKEGVRFLHLGATDYLLKDSLDRLVPAVERALQEAERQRARRLTEEKLRQSERRFYATFEQAGVGMAMVAANGHPVEVNAALRTMLGYTTTELLAMSFDDFTHPDDREADGRLFRDLVAGRLDVYHLEKRYIRKDRQEMWGRLTVSLVRGPTGQPQYAVGMVEDVTERKAGEAALQQLAAIVEAADDAIISTALDATVLTWNPAAERLFGYRRDEMVGRSITVLIPPARHDEEPSLQQRILTGERIAHYETVRLRKDGSTCDVAVTVSPVSDQHGAIVGASKIVHDITARKRAEKEADSLEQQFRQSQKMEAVGQLAGGVAHDFNNLLTVILGFSNFVLDSLAPSDPRGADLGEVIRAGQRATGLARQLLAFSRRQVLQAVALDLNRLVEGVQKMLEHLIGEQIELVTTLDPNLRIVHADPSQLEQIVLNLIVNARDAMPSGGRVAIATTNVELDESSAMRDQKSVRAGSYVMLAVSDTGVGMNDETQKRLFEPFFTTKEPGKGTGLGLSTVYAIIQQSDGYIAVDSEPGAGTTFKIYLPVADAAQDSTAAEADDVRTLGGHETVLLVEDEEAVRFLTQMILERAGYQVLAAPTPAAAETLFVQDPRRFDLLLTDVIMPGITGPALFGRLAQLRADLKVLYVSGYTDDEIFHRGQLERGVEFLQKPFTAADLTRHVREVLDR